MPLQGRRQGKEPELSANLRRNDLGCNEPKDSDRRSNCRWCVQKRKIRHWLQPIGCCDAGMWKKHGKSCRDDERVPMGHKCGDRPPKHCPGPASREGIRHSGGPLSYLLYVSKGIEGVREGGEHHLLDWGTCDVPREQECGLPPWN